MSKILHFSIIGMEPIIQIGLRGLIAANWSRSRFTNFGSIAECMGLQDHPDIIILEITSLKGLRGLKEIKRLKRQFPSSQLVVFSWLAEAFFAIPYFKSGISACLMKSADVAEIISALLNVLAGKRYCNGLAEGTLSKPNTLKELDALSDKNFAVAELQAKGIPAKVR